MIVCAFQNNGGKVFGEYGKKTAVQRGLDLVLCSVRFRIKDRRLVESLWPFKDKGLLLKGLTSVNIPTFLFTLWSSFTF